MGCFHTNLRLKKGKIYEASGSMSLIRVCLSSVISFGVGDLGEFHIDRYGDWYR